VSQRLGNSTRVVKRKFRGRRHVRFSCVSSIKTTGLGTGSVSARVSAGVDGGPAARMVPALPRTERGSPVRRRDSVQQFAAFVPGRIDGA
jgi:hypothetical protein